MQIFNSTPVRGRDTLVRMPGKALAQCLDSTHRQSSPLSFAFLPDADADADADVKAGVE